MPLRNYLMSYVMPSLSQAMLDCCAGKPEDPIDYLVHLQIPCHFKKVLLMRCKGRRVDRTEAIEPISASASPIGSQERGRMKARPLGKLYRQGIEHIDKHDITGCDFIYLFNLLYFTRRAF